MTNRAAVYSASEKAKKTRKKYRNENKEMIAEKSKQYYKNNKESFRIRHRHYYHENQEGLKVWNKEWRDNNKKRRAERGKKYRLVNKVKIKKNALDYYHRNKTLCDLKNKKWKKNNAEKYRASIAKWDAKKRLHLYDAYIRKLLNLNKEGAPKELVEVKREQLKLYRLLKEMKNGKARKCKN
jgi:hypothetical protein